MSFLKTKAFKVGTHLAGWSLSIWLFAALFRISDSIQAIDWVFSVILHSCFIPIYYLHSQLYFPFLFKKERYTLYAISSLLTILLSFWLYQFWALGVVYELFFPSYFLVNIFIPIEIFSLSSLFLIINVLIQISGSWLEAQEQRTEIANLERSIQEAKLSNLQSKMNPHFMFNALNLLYAEVLKKSDISADMVLQLANIMRYHTYTADKKYILLTEELSVVQDYISIQRKRLSQPLELTISNDFDDTTPIYLPPLLIIPLIENAFKHALYFTKSDDASFLDIQINNPKNEFVEIIISNPYKKEYAHLNDTEEGGLGLKNIQQRLKLYFSEAYTFHHQIDEHCFRIHLSIPKKSSDD